MEAGDTEISGGDTLQVTGEDAGIVITVTVSADGFSRGVTSEPTQIAHIIVASPAAIQPWLSA